MLLLQDYWDGGVCILLFVVILTILVVIRGAIKLKSSQKVEKVHNFLGPLPLPQDVLDFSELGKN